MASNLNKSDTEKLSKKRKNIENKVIEKKKRYFDKKAQAEEEKLTKELFGDNSNFLESLENSIFYENVTTTTESLEFEENLLSKERKPVWKDEEDENITVGKALNTQNRSLPNGGINTRKNLYSDLLQNKFTTLIGNPKWASLDKTKTVYDSDSEEELLRTCGHIVQSKSNFLKFDTLEYKKVKDLNQETYNEGPKITSVEFHSLYSVSLVTGVSGIATLVAVDGKNNNKLHSVAFKKFPIHCAKFINNGEEALFGSMHSHIFSYNLNAAKATEIKLPSEVTQCKKFQYSPNNKLIAVCGKWGQVHLLSSLSRELITTLKQNSPVTTVCFNSTESLLFGHSETGEVTVWDMKNQRVKHRWYDDGCIQGTTITVSPSGKYLATGSAEGVVNLYEYKDVLKNKNPQPMKRLMNLSTTINSVQFNATSEILGFCSNELKNAVKLCHVESKKVYSNFPTMTTKLGRINVVSFSPNSGYVAFGSLNSTIPLYRLKHYKNY